MSIEQRLPVPNIGLIDKPHPFLIISPSDGSSDKTDEYGGFGHSPTPTTQPAQPAHTSHPEHITPNVNTTANEFESRSDEDEPPQSAILAPPGFSDLKTNAPSRGNTPTAYSVAGPSTDSNVIINTNSPTGHGNTGKKTSNSPISPPPLTTSIEPEKDWSERATPRAQTRQDFDEIDRRSHSSYLEDIPEGTDGVEKPDNNGGDKTPEMLDLAVGHLSNGSAEIQALQAALVECWSLCNTLATLSYIHRERLNSIANMQEDAWKSCWRLCQQLYNSQVEDYAYQVNPTLDLCRDFCQSLFEARARENEISDSVLRVSFELNNHLYNTHDRNLPDAFRERTLDFYITLCHRLMKQRTRVPETDALLNACWSLAEMLFSIRQSKKEGRQLDEELLGSAVQACWELCDIFREGWTQRSLRNSDRGTPRPSQAAFSHSDHQSKQDLSHPGELSGHQRNPETPTTIFEDLATISPDEAPTQNIFVLGQGRNQVSHTNWSSNSSSVSGQTQSSEKTSSTNTVITLSNDSNITALRALIAKAAMNSGFQRTGSQSLSSFVKSLSSDAFGSMPWQTTLLKHYKRFVVFDPAFRSIGPQTRVSAVDVARAVQLMIQNGQYPWLRDLYRLVFGFHIEEAVNRSATLLQV